ncbi:MAG: glycosyltransferase family 2 protein [Bacteroidales bacterium]|nr:glycosyltransferase family 2 protein [Bacteroidales bacterium]
MEKVLTIIIPTYNMQEFIQRCINSVCSSEEAERIDVIAVNDGSKDRSLQILREESKKHSCLRIIDKQNGNYGSCINAALPEAKGKYVKVLDADDWVDTKDFTGYVRHLSETDADVSVTRFKTVYQDGDEEDWAFVGQRTGTMSVEDFFSEEKNMTLPMHRIAYRTELLRRIGYVQTEGISYTDSEWAYKPMLHAETVDVSDYSVYRYLLGREGQTMDPKVMLRSMSQEITILESMLKYRGELIGELKGRQRGFADFVVCRKALLIYTQTLLMADDKTFDANIVESVETLLKQYSEELYEKMESFDKRCFIVGHWRAKHQRYNAFVRRSILAAMKTYKKLKR